MFCENCGTKNENGTKFCTNCGNEIKVAVVSPPNTGERKVDLNAAMDNVTSKSKDLIAKGKDYYQRKPKVVYAIVGGIVLLIILIIVFGNKTMKCEADDDYTTYDVIVKYNGDGDIVKISKESTIEYDNSDFEDMLEYLDYDDVDDYLDDIKKELEEELEDLDYDGFDASIKKSGKKLVSEETYVDEALEEYLDSLDVKDVDDLEEYLEDSYTDYKCEK